MSTKIGVIAEGPVDHALIRPLLARIATERAGYRWPVAADDTTEYFPIRKRGHGGVLETVRTLVAALDRDVFPYAFFVILLDRRTRAAQEKVRNLIRGRDRFVLGIAIEEIEAWWLGDRTNTLRWVGLEDELPVDARYAKPGYLAELDDAPKRTLDQLTRASDRFDRCYGEGNVDMALEFAEGHWRGSADLAGIKAQCPRGFGAFETDVVNRFRAERRRARKARGSGS